MSSERLMELAAAAAALAAAERSGLLAALVAEPGSAEELALRLSLHPPAVERVLEVLRTRQVVDFEAGCYRPSAELTELFDGPLGQNDRAFRIFAHTASFLRDGSAVMPGTATAAVREKTYTEVISTLARLFEAAAGELAGILDERLGPPRSLLDVGAGSGVWGLAQLARHDEAELTGLDLPHVCERFVERAAALGLDGRVSALAGDMHVLDVPHQRFDRIVVANVLHLETPPRAQALIARLVPALAPGGHLIVIDSMSGETPARDRARAAYALYLALRIENGFPHHEADLRRWLTEAGLEPGERIDLAARPDGLSALPARRSKSS